MNKRVRFVIAAMLIGLMGSAAFLHGCGKDRTVVAPNGSTMTINPNTVTIKSADGNTRIPMTVVVLSGTTSVPENNMKVTVSGGFASPFNPPLYEFQDENGNTLPSGFTGITDANGTLKFWLFIPSTIVKGQLSMPQVALTPNTPPLGPFLAPGVYNYRVTAGDNNVATASIGETDAEPSQAITVAANETVTVSWGPVDGATFYNVYRTAAGGAPGTETLLFQLTGATFATSFIDNGTKSLGVTAVPTVNSTGYILKPNSFSDNVDASSGTAFVSATLSFN